MSKLALTLVVSCAFLVIGSSARMAAQNAPPPVQHPAAQAAPLGPREPTAEDLTREMRRLPDGLFTLFMNEPTDRSKDPERPPPIIPNRALGQDLLLATSLSQGGYFTGWMWDGYLFRFEVRGKQLAIVIPEVRYPAQRDDPVSEVVQRTYNS